MNPTGCLPPPHQRMETDSVSKTLCSLGFFEYQMMDKGQKPSNSKENGLFQDHFISFLWQKYCSPENSHYSCSLFQLIWTKFSLVSPSHGSDWPLVTCLYSPSDFSPSSHQPWRWRQMLLSTYMTAQCHNQGYHSVHDHHNENFNTLRVYLYPVVVSHVERRGVYGVSVAQ
jgi:hypothetical protein